MISLFTHHSLKIALSIVVVVLMISSCANKKGKFSDEQLQVEADLEVSEDTLDSDPLPTDSSGLSKAIGMSQLASFPSKVILTGLSDHRLISIYKMKKKDAGQQRIRSFYSYDNDESSDDTYEHFMPGLDILYGYELINLAHYDMKTHQRNFLFKSPVLIKTVYYPSFIPDSINKKPIQRNYYLISVYDEDTNKDTLINKRDLRKFYLFNERGMSPIALLPAGYSISKSQYDIDNDAMFLFARYDENKNGSIEQEEPKKVFWIHLKNPSPALMAY
ncbi:MAG: hypothetical protein MUF42_05930 [Cytophagaceae bacterium]|jgi:hypothetical protein|nr:hypothetical protein [Cytophagaceae bacterium]